jgi:predicted ribosome quality control (RQC) complex YloA/Tae2 family protein
MHPLHACSLAPVQAELVAGGYMKAPPEAALAAKAASKARRAHKRSGGAAGSSGTPGYREYLSPGGLRVLVGRNSRQNDELTMRVANTSDVWMHARGVPGGSWPTRRCQSL